MRKDSKNNSRKTNYKKAGICIGMAASMGAFLLSGGAKGKRMALPNAEIMIHHI